MSVEINFLKLKLIKNIFKCKLQELDLLLDIAYEGGAKLSVDVTAIMQRKAYLSVQVC